MDMGLATNPGWIVFQDCKLNGMATSWKKIQGENSNVLVLESRRQFPWTILTNWSASPFKECTFNSVWDNPRKYNMIKQTKHARMQREIVCSDEWHQTHVKMEKQIKKRLSAILHRLSQGNPGNTILPQASRSRLTSTTLRNDTPLWFMEGWITY